MAVKKSRNRYSGIIYIVLSIFLIFVILIILYNLYYHLKPKEESRRQEAVAENRTEAFKQLEDLRNRKGFAWPLTGETLKGLALTEHSAFSLGYSEDHEQAAWVAYLITREHTKNQHERRNNFRADPGIKTASASPADYFNSGFDRGHLAPAADFDFSRKALSETFYMSNISPQKPELNRGKWKELEDQVRNWATEYDSHWVITGPVLEKGLKKIGTNKVSVPKYFYKIILDPRQPGVKMIGFIMANNKNTKSLEYYVVPVDSIERLSQLDFFPQMPDLLEDSLEKHVIKEAWFTHKKK